MSVVSRLLVYAAFTIILDLAQGQQQRFPVTGLTTGIQQSTGQRPARINVNQLQANGGPQWNLFLLGLSSLQNQSESDYLSFFQISGIHGRPYIPWNGVEAVPGGSGGPFCTHGEVQFAPWHRPYVALFEQLLGQHVQTIASQYVGRSSAAYKAAAQTLRLPYWDWATDASLPPSAVPKRVTVQAPHGVVNIPNPLHSYRWQQFPLNNSTDYFPSTTPPQCWNNSETMRLIDDEGLGEDASSMNLDGGQLRDNVYRVFTSVKDFETMASTANEGMSFEDPHNTVHNAVGVIMSDLEYSAFDPIFWLHHCNVDRMIALWQAINYNNTYQTQTTTTGGQFSVPAGTKITADSPLAPFFQDDQNPHTGKTAASIKNFGYTYPEINDWSLKPEDTKQEVIAEVNFLYGNGTSQSRRRTRAQAWHKAPASWKEFYVQIGVERSELDLPCTINILLGSKLAGSMTILSMPTSGRTHSEVLLNRVLREFTSCLEPDAVIPVLEHNFRIEIKKNDGTIIPADSIPSLTIDVKDEDVVAPGSMIEFPKHGIPNSWPNIGKPVKTIGLKREGTRLG